MRRDEATSFIKAQSPDAFLEKAKKTGWICPACGNGSGRTGDGIVENPKNRGSYKCFKCNIGGDIFDLIGVTFGLRDFNDQFDKAKDIYGVDVDRYEDSPATKTERRQAVNHVVDSVALSAPASDGLSAYFKKCHDNAGQTSYFKDRGLSQSTVDRFGLGYDADFTDNGKLKYPMSAIIIPESADTFEARNVSIVPGGDGFRYYKHGKTALFNITALKEERELPIFIVEGVIDALSIIEAGGQAIGLGSAVNYKLLVAALNKISPAKPLLLLFDTDDAGKQNEAALSKELDKLNVPYLSANEVIGGHHDANDRLVKDADGLKKAVKLMHEKVAALPDPKEEAKDAYLQTSAGKSIPGLLKQIKQNAERPRLSTGFEDIDEALDGGIFTGFYIIGAISSLGKTTLTLQIADNLAKQGRDVIFFSLEQSKYDLMSKSISRETFLYCRGNGKSESCAKSNLGILDGRRWASYSKDENEVLAEAVKTYAEYAKHLFIYEGIGNISVEEIREKVKKHISITGNAHPIVFIDYLQILKAAEGDERATDKQIVDRNVTALKQMSRDFDIPIVAVSSLNRDNYKAKINMAAFKESGAIEYGSDVLIGLQLTGAGEDGFDADKEKQKNPRQVDFCILKNRNGKIVMDGLTLSFYPVFNCFISDGGFVSVSVEDEDDIPFD